MYPAPVHCVLWEKAKRLKFSVILNISSSVNKLQYWEFTAINNKKFDKEAIVQLQRECSAVTGGRGGASPAQWVRRSDYLLECHRGQGLQHRARDRTSVEQFIPFP